MHVEPELDGERLDKAIAKLGDISRRLARRTIASGGVFVDGRRVQVAGRTVSLGQKLLVHLQESDRTVSRAKGHESSLGGPAIIYEDEDLLAVDKPAGISAQATLTSTRGLPEAVSEAIGGPARLVHRLDLDTSGITVLARHRRAVSALTRAFREGMVEKTYVAVATGRPFFKTHASLETGLEPVRSKARPACSRREAVREECPHQGSALAPNGSDEPTNDDAAPEGGVFDWRIAKDPVARGRRRAVVRGGVSAVTRWSLIEHFGEDLLERGASTIRLEPETGRTHQIRVHLERAGAPILGDRRYGAPTFVTFPDGKRIEIPRMMLHASRLTLPHPRTGRPLTIKAPIPADLRQFVIDLGGQPSLLSE